MSTVGFEPTIPASERPQTYALDRAATGTGIRRTYPLENNHPPTLREFYISVGLMELFKNTCR